MLYTLWELFGLFELEWEKRKREEGKSGIKTGPKEREGRGEEWKKEAFRLCQVCVSSYNSNVNWKITWPGHATTFLAEQRHCWLASYLSTHPFKYTNMPRAVQTQGINRFIMLTACDHWPHFSFFMNRRDQVMWSCLLHLIEVTWYVIIKSCTCVWGEYTGNTQNATHFFSVDCAVYLFVVCVYVCVSSYFGYDIWKVTLQSRKTWSAGFGTCAANYFSKMS